MLDQLVESKSNSAENKRRGEFIVVIALVAVASLLTMWTVSLFGKDFGMGTDDLSLTTLVAPVPVADEEPPPKPDKQPEKQIDADVRKELIQNIMQSPVKPPDQISVAKLTIPPMRLNRATVQGDSNADLGRETGVTRVVDQQGQGGLATDAPKDKGSEEDDAPPPPKKAPPKTISGGVLNGKATSLPKPAYPAAAKAIHATGSVTVQVLIDESGRVVSASATSGHPLLRAAAVSAAQGARFSPTLLSGQAVKVTGVITYNFTQ